MRKWKFSKVKLFLEVTQLVSGGASIQTPVCLLPRVFGRSQVLFEAKYLIFFGPEK